MIDAQIKKQLDDDMQRGYSYEMKSDSVSACNEWNKVWKSIVSIMDSGEYNNISALDDDFNGTQCIYNWASDYEMALGNTSYKDISFSKARINFCRQYLNYVPDKNELNSLNMKRAIAESFFSMGNIDEGEMEFKSITEENPTWGWGWIGWSDEYGIYSKEGNRNIDKAIEILKQALGVDGIDEEGEIKTRLKEIYISCGMSEDANSIIIEKKVFGTLLSNVGHTLSDTKLVSTEVRKVPKIGRNEPCPCGSGKKYKKCCGNN